MDIKIVSITSGAPVILAIDPSLRNLGFAILDRSGIPRRVFLLHQTTDADASYHLRCCAMARCLAYTAKGAIEELYGAGMRVNVILEVPTNWFSDKALASKDSEDIQKLYLQVGVLIGMLAEASWVESIWGVAPNQWKGSAPKHVMVARAKTFAAQQQLILAEDTPHDSCEALLLARDAYLHRAQRDDGSFSSGYAKPYQCIHQRHRIDSSTFECREFLKEK